MNVIDYSKKFKNPSSNRSQHSAFFPKNIMAVIAGSTGSGKTNLLLNLLTEKGVLDYNKVYVYSSTLFQPAYVYLKEFYEKLSKSIGIKIGHFYSTDDDILDPSQLDPHYSNLMVFDDVMLTPQSIIKDYFCRGRHNNLSVFYLVQSLHKISKHCIRDNANIFILFRQDDKTLRYFHETHISADMDWNEFKQFCYKAWKIKHGFVVINIWDDPYCGRYLENYNNVYIPRKFEK